MIVPVILLNGMLQPDFQKHTGSVFTAKAATKKRFRKTQFIIYVAFPIVNTAALINIPINSSIAYKNGAT
jgi:hypothetical protein